MKYTPHDYQKEAIKFLVSHGAAALFLDPGLGKTSITYAAFKVLRTQRLVRKMLVISPLRPAHSVWPGEREKWDDFKDLKVVVLHGPDKAKLLASDADVYVINPEGLSWLFQHCPKNPWLWDMLVVDESTRFKHANTVRFKTLKPWLNSFHRRYILTGSPAPNGLLDLFGQIYILDLGNALGRFITHYRVNYFDPTGYGGYTWVPRKGSAEKIYDRLRPLVLRMAAKDLIELPELVFNRVEVELPDAAMKAYRQMETMLMAALGDELVMAANAAAVFGKCRQIANGGIFHDDGEEFSHIHEAKLDAVEEIVDELQGRPCLISYEYRHDLDRLLKRFPDVPRIGGGVTAARFKEIERGWNAGLIPVLLAQPQSVAHGLNLQGTGAHVVFHSLTPDLEVDEQFIRRVWRQGQRERVMVHRVVAKNTIDEDIMSMLDAKDKTQRTLLNALKKRTRKA